MHLLINFATLKKGGGQNVGLNFIMGLDISKYSDVKFYFAVAKDSQIEKVLIERGFSNIISLSQSAGKRMIEELTIESRYIKDNKIDIVYSYFGYAFFKGNIPQVCGVADSNLFFPEIDFWEGYTGIVKVKKDLIDNYRIWGYKRAAGLVFENAAMEHRAKRIFGKNCNTVFIKPSFIFDSNDDNAIVVINKNEGTKYGLFLCSWQRNKGILRIPGIINEAKKKGFSLEICISTSIDATDDVCIEFLKEVEKYDAANYIHYLGTIKKDQMKDLYSKIDYIFLLSRLESFSNNIIEAWYYRKPLIIADEEWAHGICNDAALYVDRNRPDKIIDAILQASFDGTLDLIVGEGEKEFNTYPTIEEKVEEEINYVKRIYKMVKN